MSTGCTCSAVRMLCIARASCIVSARKHIILCLWLSFAFCLRLSSQDAYKGQFHISRQHLSHQGGSLRVELDVDYSSLSLASSEYLTLVPVLRTETYSKALPSILVNGSSRHKVYEREERAFHRSGGRKSASDPVLVVADGGPSRSFTYKVTIPFQEWMRNAVLFLRTEECDCRGGGGVFEDKIGSGGIRRFSAVHTSFEPSASHLDFDLLSRIHTVSPRVGDAKKFHHRGSFSSFPSAASGASFPLSSSSWGFTHYEVYYRLREALHEVQNQPGVEISMVRITGFGSPSGDFRKNERSAPHKAAELKSSLRSQGIFSGVPLEVHWMPEDWNTILTEVQHSSLPFRDVALDIIRNVPVDKGRERMLMDFNHGSLYRQLREEIFPKACRIEYEIGYTYTSDPSVLSNTESHFPVDAYYRLAVSYPKGSDRYNDMLALGGTLYPDSPEMQINAGAIALLRGDLGTARRYLVPLEHLPAAYNNLSVLYALEGNKDKAEVYFQLSEFPQPSSTNGQCQLKERGKPADFLNGELEKIKRNSGHKTR